MPGASRPREGAKWGTPLALASNTRIKKGWLGTVESSSVVQDLIDTDPLDSDFPETAPAYFKTIGWAQGASMLLDVHPNYSHRVNIA